MKRGLLILLVLAACAVVAVPLLRPEKIMTWSQGRSMVSSQLGIAAAEQPLAAQAGASILARGGSAADAAIATSAAMGVMQPMMNGMGGDLFAIEYDSKSGKVNGLNSSGWAPEGLTLSYLQSKGLKRIPETGILSVSIPGCVMGWWELHERFGKLPWKELFQPAIYYASHGFPIAQWNSMYWPAYADVLRKDEEATRIYLPGGQPLKLGEVFRNPEYAQALELLANEGERAFYDGAIAQAIVKTSQELGGVISSKDLSEYKAEWVDPLETNYRGWKVFEIPPNSQGIAALEMLNIMAQFPLSTYGAESAERFHIEMQAQQLAYADLHRYVGDPRFVRVPVQGMLSVDYAKSRAGLIDPGEAKCNFQPGTPPGADPNIALAPLHPGKDTSYLTVVDRDGNVVSLIQSLAGAFGSGVAVRGYGIILQNRATGFTLRPGSPDVLAPHKRPFHTIIPAFMERGDLHIGFGIMRGGNQPLAHAQFVSDVADYGMNIQQALEAPRFNTFGQGGCSYLIESRVPKETLTGLSVLGYDLRVAGPYAEWVGGGQAVLHNSATGVNSGASDPRKDGEAVPEPPPQN
ncbi:MAG: gamma-glutamyltransferase [Acidobacteria bacterium]|nr:MAG: gamma-glutamyltransferase [Acidobacteriota bacterium]